MFSFNRALDIKDYIWFVLLIVQTVYGTRHENPWFANNKGADQSANTRSLISAFVIRLL